MLKSSGKQGVPSNTQSWCMASPGSWFRALFFAILFGSSTVAVAESGNTQNEATFEQIIAAQQAQIDAQKQELAAQKEMILKLAQQVQQFTGNGHESPVVVDSDITSDQEITSPPAIQEQKTESDWPGSFGLFGTKTRLAIDGFVQLDLIHDWDAIGAPCEFITSTIPTDGGTMVQGASGDTNFCINASRLSLESRTPTRTGQLKTFISMDLYGDALSTSPDPRIRQAYAELTGALWGGDLLLGQAWGTYVDLEAWPNVLDFEGPGSAIALRQPMVRWSKRTSANTDFQIALEQAGDGSVDGADMLTSWPDLVANFKWRFAGDSHLRGAGILRDIRVSADDGPAESSTGWGIAGSGKIGLPAHNNFVFELSYGKGVGAYYNDSPPNGVYDPANSNIMLLPLFAYYLGLEHDWSETLSSTILYSALTVDNLNSQPDEAGKKSAYFSLNLIWQATPQQMYGIEFLRGGRRDKGGSEGTDNRIQMTGHFSLF